MHPPSSVLCLCCARPLNRLALALHQRRPLLLHLCSQEHSVQGRRADPGSGLSAWMIKYLLSTGHRAGRDRRWRARPSLPRCASWGVRKRSDVNVVFGERIPRLGSCGSRDTLWSRQPQWLRVDTFPCGPWPGLHVIGRMSQGAECCPNPAVSTLLWVRGVLTMSVCPSPGPSEPSLAWLPFPLMFSGATCQVNANTGLLVYQSASGRTQPDAT